MILAIGYTVVTIAISAVVIAAPAVIVRVLGWIARPLRHRWQRRAFNRDQDPFCIDIEQDELDACEWAQLHLTAACWREKAREPRYPDRRKAGQR